MICKFKIYQEIIRGFNRNYNIWAIIREDRRNLIIAFDNDENYIGKKVNMKRVKQLFVKHNWIHI